MFLAIACNKSLLKSYVMKFLLILLAFLLFAGRATAEDLVVDRAILDDPAGLMTVADVQGAAFKPADSVITRVLNPSVFWLRLTVKVPQAKHGLVMSISPSFVEQLTLFYSRSADLEATTVELDSRSAQMKTELDLAPGLQTVYLRVNSRGFIYYPVIQTHEDFSQKNQAKR